jgi:hypothetical protein
MLSDMEEDIKMQLTNTQVGGPSDCMITIEFQGGGELVSVKMAAGDNVQGDAAVVRAKAFMVQLTRSMIASKQWVRGASPATNSKSVTGGFPRRRRSSPWYRRSATPSSSA